MSTDRKQLIRLAASRPVGDPVRRVLLGEIRKCGSPNFDRWNPDSGLIEDCAILSDELNLDLKKLKKGIERIEDAAGIKAFDYMADDLYESEDLSSSWEDFPLTHRHFVDRPDRKRAWTVWFKAAQSYMQQIGRLQKELTETQSKMKRLQRVFAQTGI